MVLLKNIHFFVDKLDPIGNFVQMGQSFKKFFLFFAFFSVISSSAVWAVPSVEKSESRGVVSVIRFLVVTTNPLSPLSLHSSQLDQKLSQKLKKIVNAVKSSAVKVAFALKVKPSIRLKKTHSRKISRLSKVIIKPEGAAVTDLLHADSGDLGHYSGAINAVSRLQVFYSECSAHYGKKTSDGSDRKGCTRLFGGSIYGRQSFSCSKNSSTNMSRGLAEVKVRCRLCEHVRAGLFRVPKDNDARRLMMVRKPSMPNISNSGYRFKLSNFYIFSTVVNNSMHLV